MDNFWTAKPSRSSTWIWRNLLALREQFRPRFLISIGDGQLTNAWYDKWFPIGPLSRYITPRLMHGIGLTAMSKVADLLPIINQSWPNEWIRRWPDLRNVAIPTTMPGVRDSIQWLDNSNHQTSFTVAEVWKTLDGPYERVSWFEVCWFPNHIPKHAFCLWLALQGRLSTQDRIQEWRRDTEPLLCPLCRLCTDSHVHLFFECPFSKFIWDDVRNIIGLPMPDRWDKILEDIDLKRWKFSFIRQKLLFQATVYFIWKERNDRLFSNIKRKRDVLLLDIKRVVHMRLRDRRCTRNNDL